MDRRQLHQRSTLLLSTLMILVGIALVVRSLLAGGGGLATGVILGVLFVVAGAGRLYLAGRAR